jgi:hypothetical protein
MEEKNRKEMLQYEHNFVGMNGNAIQLHNKRSQPFEQVTKPQR